jgi:hypothetical protein
MRVKQYFLLLYKRYSIKCRVHVGLLVGCQQWTNYETVSSVMTGNECRKNCWFRSQKDALTKINGLVESDITRWDGRLFQRVTPCYVRNCSLHRGYSAPMWAREIPYFFETGVRGTACLENSFATDHTHRPYFQLPRQFLAIEFELIYHVTKCMLADDGCIIQTLNTSRIVFS